MVPTTVERLREGQGVRERLLRGIKVERSYKRADGSTEIESGESRCYMGTVCVAGPVLTSHNQHYSSLLVHALSFRKLSLLLTDGTGCNLFV